MPSAMPIFGIASVDKFDLEQNDSVNEDLGGASHATEWAFPHWECSMTTTNMTVYSERYLNWRSFIDSCRGRKKTAYFTDPRKPYPMMYRKTGFAGLVKAGTSTAFNGTAAIASFTSRTEIVVTGLPTLFDLKRTDYVEFRKGNAASLHRLIVDAKANAGGTVTLIIEPRLPLAFTADSIVQFARPSFLGYLDGTPKDSSGIESGTISFQAKSIVTWGGGVVA